LKRIKTGEGTEEETRRREEEMENGNGEGKGEFINQNNDFFLDSMSMLSSLPPCWDPSLPPPPPPPQSLFHALAVDAPFPDQFHHPQVPKLLSYIITHQN